MDGQSQPEPSPSVARLNRLRERRRQEQLGGGPARIERQHQAGKLSARERIDRLIDPQSFQEMNLFAAHRCNYLDMASKHFPAEGVITGAGSINGRLVHLASQDFTVSGGSAGETHSDKIVEMMRHSLKTGSPFIFINDSGGARVQEGVDSLSGYSRVFYHNTLLSGVVPQIALICGPCAGGAAYSPALTDFIIQTRHGQMFITGPRVIKQVTGEDVTAEALGGPMASMARAGVTHFIANDDDDAIAICQRLLSFLPSNNSEDPPHLTHSGDVYPDEALNTLIPDDPRQPYDMKQVIHSIVDQGDFLEVQEYFATNLIIGFGRILGRTVGIVANQPIRLAGVLDIDASDKGAKFIRFCNCFNIPLITLVDVPGFMPGTKQEHGGIIRHGAKLLFAYSAATVPKLTIVLRKAYGGAYVAMCPKDLGADRVAAWPTAEIAVMGAEGAVEIIYKDEIDRAADPEARRNDLMDEYCQTFFTPYVAAARRLVDDIIEPSETRRYLAMSLEYLTTKRDMRPPKKHGLIPL